MEPFKGTDVDVLILTNNVDEILFQQNENFKGKKFVNVESSYEQIYKDLGKKADESITESRIPEEDVTGFCLWLKNELSEFVNKVTLSKRLKETPGIITGDQSSSMRMMMQMLEAQQQGSTEMPKVKD